MRKRRRKSRSEGDRTGDNQLIARSLASVRLFESFSTQAVRSVGNACRWSTYSSGETIIEKGENSHDVYFLVAGSVRVLNFASSGRVVAYASVGVGSFFGELAAIDGRPRSATVVAEAPCTVAILPAREFRRLITSRPDVALSLLERLAEIIRTCNDRIFDLTSLGAMQRVCVELLRLAEPDLSGSDHWVVDPLPTQTAIARNAGTTRETVARAIARLSAGGMVKRTSKALHIHDRKRLEGLVLRDEVVG